ncbi:hypothetical protein PMPD1_1058 [Paramixta manurensis]|uniref:Two-component-system connector protein AriR n=1 Tax=Paramixta manurensis TaxID=2740817 RepID=A0A6M8U934_9GAMM|nr:hypothetical protein PMPD1_1058 [Erwiniaceae bacterium PD-1]
MSEKIDIHSALYDTELAQYFRRAGDMLAEESALLGTIIRNIVAEDGHLTNKAIILSLINALELTSDAAQADRIYKTLEIVVNHTLDDV